MRWLVTCLLAALAASGAPAVARAQAGRPDLGDYAVLGLEGVTLGERVRIDGGDVGANRGEARLESRVRVGGAVAATTIRLGRKADAEALFCFILVGRPTFTCTAFQAPLVDTSSLPLVQARPGAMDLELPPRATTAPLPADDYGAVRVGARAQLLLAGGDYNLRRLTLAHRSRLLCAAPCRLRVQEKVTVGQQAQIGPAASTDGQAVLLEIEGRAGRTGFVTRARAAVTGTVYAPENAIVLGERGKFAGSFAGSTVTVRSHARITGPRGS